MSEYDILVEIKNQTDQMNNAYKKWRNTAIAVVSLLAVSLISMGVYQVQRTASHTVLIENIQTEQRVIKFNYVTRFQFENQNKALEELIQTLRKMDASNSEHTDKVLKEYSDYVRRLYVETDYTTRGSN